MKTAIYDKEDLSKLEEWAHEFFGSIKSWEVDVPSLLKFVWIIEDLEPYYKNTPGRYISHLLGYEGPNSILSYIMDEGLAIAFSAGYMPDVITVEVELIKKGLENYQQVCNIVFAYLKMLREKGANERIFEEIKKIAKFQFDFKDKEKPIGYTISLVSRMHNYPVLKIGYLMEEYKPDLIEKTINSLATKNVRIYLTSKSVEKDCNQPEKWYGTKYSCEPLNEEFRKIATISDEEFKKYVESVRVTIAQKDLSIVEEGNRFWQEVNQHKYIFNRIEVELEALSALTKEQLIDHFEQVFYRNRKLLEFHLVSDNHMEENGKVRAEKVANQTNIKSASTPEELRKKLPQYPDLYLPSFNSNV